MKLRAVQAMSGPVARGRGRGARGARARAGRAGRGRGARAGRAGAGRGRGAAGVARGAGRGRGAAGAGRAARGTGGSLTDGRTLRTMSTVVGREIGLWRTQPGKPQDVGSPRLAQPQPCMHQRVGMLAAGGFFLGKNAGWRPTGARRRRRLHH